MAGAGVGGELFDHVAAAEFPRRVLVPKVMVGIDDPAICKVNQVVPRPQHTRGGRRETHRRRGERVVPQWDPLSQRDRSNSSAVKPASDARRWP